MKPSKAASENVSYDADDATRTFTNDLDKFVPKLSFLLVEEILPAMGSVRKAMLSKFVDGIMIVVYQIRALEHRLSFSKSSHQSIRKSRQLYGRSRIHITKSLDELAEAEKVFREHEQDTRPGAVDFRRPTNDLKRLQSIFVELEATSAALIHPGLRTSEDKRLAEATPYNLRHPDLPITEGSAGLQYRAVALIDEQLQILTQGKVQPIHAQRFISAFLKTTFGAWCADVDSTHFASASDGDRIDSVRLLVVFELLSRWVGDASGFFSQRARWEGWIIQGPHDCQYDDVAWICPTTAAHSLA